MEIPARILLGVVLYLWEAKGLPAEGWSQPAFGLTVTIKVLVLLTAGSKNGAFLWVTSARG